MKKAVFLLGVLLSISVWLCGSLLAQEIKVPFSCETPVAMTSPAQSPEIAIVNLMLKMKKIVLSQEQMEKSRFKQVMKVIIL